MIQNWRILEPRNLILLFPMRDAAPMSAVGFARVAIEAAILNDVIRHADPLVIEQHFDGGSPRAGARIRWIGFSSLVICRMRSICGTQLMYFVDLLQDCLEMRSDGFAELAKAGQVVRDRTRDVRVHAPIAELQLKVTVGKCR